MEHVKNAAQIEFANLMGEMEDRGFKPTDVATMLGLSRSSVSQYLAGNTTPKSPTLALFRRIVAEGRAKEHVQQIEARTAAPEALQEKLSALALHDPSGFQAAKSTIEALHRRLEPIGKSGNYPKPLNMAERQAVEGSVPAQQIARKLRDKKSNSKKNGGGDDFSQRLTAHLSAGYPTKEQRRSAARKRAKTTSPSPQTPVAAHSPPSSGGRGQA